MSNKSITQGWLALGQRITVSPDADLLIGHSLRSCAAQARLTVLNCANPTLSSRFCRFVGTMMGLPVTTLLLWWHWPEAHGFVLQPASCTIVGVTMICDLIYPFVLAQVQATEEMLPDGTIIAPWDARASKKHS